MAVLTIRHFRAPLGADSCSSRRRLSWVRFSLAGILFLAVSAGLCGFDRGGRTTALAFAQEPQSVSGTAAQAYQSAVIDFGELARTRASGSNPAARRIIHHPLPGPQSGGGAAGEVSERLAFLPGKLSHGTHQAEAGYTGTGDNGTMIPPDTMGAVGPNNVVEMLNSNVQIFTRAGALVSSVTLTGFWSKLSVGEAFDPHITYDPYSGRWIVSAGADAQTASAAILVGVSQTSDPTGAWNLYKVRADATGTTWADFPTLGFNRDWIVVQANMFTMTNGFSCSKLFIFNKSDLYAAGAGLHTVIQEPSGFTDFPATTFDNTIDTEYLMESQSAFSGRLMISTITGPVGSEVLTAGVAYPTVSSTWHSSGPAVNFAPQLGDSRGIDTDDDRILSCVYRNGALWAAQTVFLPAGGNASSVTRSSAQWWEIDVSPGNLGVILQFGRIDDPSNTLLFAYPTLAVNKNNDVLIGYSRFSAAQYASANYSFRHGTDPANTMQTDTVLKAGLAPYYKDFSTGDNRWGDYSATVVDPVDDNSMWTLQEYAGTNNMWGTWWGLVSPSGTGSSPTPTPAPTAAPTAAPKPTATPTPTPAATATPKPKTKRK